MFNNNSQIRDCAFTKFRITLKIVRIALFLAPVHNSLSTQAIREFAATFPFTFHHANIHRPNNERPTLVSLFACVLAFVAKT